MVGFYYQYSFDLKDKHENDWHYIHPDFRGPNRTSQACGSPLVLSDIDDAISYALENKGF